MIEVTLEDVVVRVLTGEGGGEAPRLGSRQLRIVLLREKDGDRVLPIWIGSVPRPLSADLMARLLEASGGKVERVTISSLRDKTFYSTIALAARGATHEIDARPSDALNLAVRVGAPIELEESILESSGIRADEVLGKLESESPFQDEPEGEWRSLSADLLETLHPPWPTKP